MLTPATAETYPALVVKPGAPWRVAHVETLPGHRLQVTFVDGLSGKVEMGPWLASSAVAGTVFEPLRDEEVFRRVFLDLGAVTWPGGADLAPDAMYDEIRRNGRWVLE
ncbi:MAG: DUF2442 domain-containing protein [Deltaproteobacteria bacterium]|nr:DUF2442 domain-containing protein [Deltaproteobacteria bacterium]